MPKASRILAALKRDGWVELAEPGPHRTLKRARIQQRWAYHDGEDLGNSQMPKIAKDFGYTLADLREIL